MNLPQIHNQRSEEQWQIISEHADFKNKSVIDLGCGYADILMKCYQAGAQLCCGVEKNSDIATEASLRVDNLPKAMGQDIFITQSDIERTGDWPMDYAICFSVLPYLENPIATLRWIKYYSKVTFIECQYRGDGPGFDWLVSNDDMKDWLEQAGFKSARVIGKTLVKDRRKYRDIWMCK